MFSSLRVAQIVGVSGAMWLSGNIATLSLISIPALQRSALEDGVSALTLAKQWRQNFEAGKAQNPPVAAVIASAFAYLAWSARSGSAFHKFFPRNATIWYSTAAVLTLGIVPYTILAMTKTNNALIQASNAKPGEKVDDLEARALTSKWIQLNAVRSCLPLAGGIVALVAALA
ncbi:hypothetical protein CNB02545 [Cryptococcus deneoformans JEC21]|uniref:DUF1772 domain-containing protein n=1 Tax=Cryptococcus deneoformans (strain JEC21 / ATCC MYA-565) TaxID=214684 RepID=A0A0S2LI58_CRYD1|nr:hypothetical protein CNB02545 [Cryptococcus neoformans var. neoformans JEC21]ALO60391.1 hypothetical protein CNB02545 [Cryptococcus neoformans var. neoformans JEC21]